MIAIILCCDDHHIYSHVSQLALQISQLALQKIYEKHFSAY